MDQKKSLLAKISDLKNHLDPPVIKMWVGPLGLFYAVSLVHWRRNYSLRPDFLDDQLWFLGDHPLTPPTNLLDKS